MGCRKERIKEKCKSSVIMTLQEKIQKKAKEYEELASVFLEGAKFALENQWISAEDSLPYNYDELIKTKEETLSVITINKYEIIEENYMIYSDNRWKWRFYIPDIIYWMPIPKLPKE